MKGEREREEEEEKHSKDGIVLQMEGKQKKIKK